MSFPRVYREIEEMARQVLLETPTARDIARKSGVRLGVGGARATVDLLGQFARITPPFSALGHIEVLQAISDYAFPGAFALASFPRERSMMRYFDWTGFTEARVLTTVTQASTAAASMYFAIQTDNTPDAPTNPLAFSPEAPSAPLNETGIHVSEWRTIVWPSTFRSFEGWFRIANPTLATDEVGLGLCQVQVR